MADPDSPVGASNINPNMATSQAESEGTANPSTSPVVGAGQAQGSSQSPAPGPETSATGGSNGAVPTDSVSDAFDSIVTGVNSLKSSLGDSLLAKQPGKVLKATIAEAQVGPSVVKMAKILQAHPEITTTVDPLSLLAGASEVDAMQAAEDAVGDLLGRIQYTRKSRLDSIWKDARNAYSTASRDAADDGSLADALAPMASLFVRTKRDVSAAQVAATDALQATKDAVKTSKATAKATASRERANALAPQLATTGTGDATISQPAPSAPASSTTSPAPGGTPGTPGSTTIG